MVNFIEKNEATWQHDRDFIGNDRTISEQLINYI